MSLINDSDEENCHSAKVPPSSTGPKGTATVAIVNLLCAAFVRSFPLVSALQYSHQEVRDSV